jgi:NAD(P)-dependent dehydrogenase (short-subunit alcohol dehydrogenase family)
MNEPKLDGKLALITGASRGLGKAMALAMAREGARLLLVARNEQLLDETAAAARDLGAEAETFVTDVTREEQVQALAGAVGEKHGKIQILINNAGVNLRKPFLEFSLEDWQHVMNTNLTSVFLLCRSFIPLMTGQGFGRIINLTSIMSHISIPGRVAYTTSKAGLLGMTKALALELAPEGITVNGISPGPFATEMNLPLLNNPEVKQFFLSRLPVGHFGNPQDIGALAVYLSSPEAGFITGTDILIDGGWLAQ